ncbi:hypothetical protein ACS5PU_08690 [Pedobacter sp. GSP4]|uniref:hypothetical protein n=1 Tax=Pedobacter sp. GSP4 TaxID=3453716 RepID=UPI003EEBE64C
MPQVLVTGGSQITYEILKDFHTAAEGVYNIRKSKGQSLEEDYEFQVLLEAENEEEAKAIFIAHAEKLADLGVHLHIGHLAYITIYLKSIEGNFILEESTSYKILSSNLSLLTNLIKLQKCTGKISLEITDNLVGKEFEEYTKLRDEELISAALQGTIGALISAIKRDEHLVPFSLIEEVKNLKPSLDDITALNRKLIVITNKAFNSQMLYTICKTLRNYLNTYSPLRHPTATLTNDQARVIYETCKLHGLINLPHEMDIEKINYIRSVITNSTHLTSLNTVLL